MKKCSKCGYENSDHAKFCKECGESLNEYNFRCPRCNSVSASTNKICPKCGFRFNSSTSYETQSISTIGGSEIDEETYLEEAKTIKNKALNKKINLMSISEKNKPNKKVNEYNEDFTDSSSKISAEKMLNYENKFQFISLICSFVLLFLATIFSFLPLDLTYSGNEILYISPYVFLRDNWGQILNGFKYGYLANGIAHGFAPFFQFFFILGFMIYSASSLIYVFIKGVKAIQDKEYQNNFYKFIIFNLLLLLITQITISFDVMTFTYYPTYFILMILEIIYLAFYGIYHIFKAYLVNATTLFIRRIASTITFILSTLVLIFLSYRIIAVRGGTIPIHTYLTYLLYSYNIDGNNTAFYLGFMGYMIYFLLALFVCATTYYAFNSIKRYNHSKLYFLIFSSFSFFLSIVSFILFTVSCYYSNLNETYSLTLYPLTTLVFCGLVFGESVINLILFKDENILIKRSINDIKE